MVLPRGQPHVWAYLAARSSINPPSCPCQASTSGAWSKSRMASLTGYRLSSGPRVARPHPQSRQFRGTPDGALLYVGWRQRQQRKGLPPVVPCRWLAKSNFSLNEAVDSDGLASARRRTVMDA